MIVSDYGRAIRLGSGRRSGTSRMRPKLLTSLGWFAVLAGLAVAVGAAFGFAH